MKEDSENGEEETVSDGKQEHELEHFDRDNQGRYAAPYDSRYAGGPHNSSDSRHVDGHSYPSSQKGGSHDKYTSPYGVQFSHHGSQYSQSYTGRQVLGTFQRYASEADGRPLEREEDSKDDDGSDDENAQEEVLALDGEDKNGSHESKVRSDAKDVDANRLEEENSREQKRPDDYASSPIGGHFPTAVDKQAHAETARDSVDLAELDSGFAGDTLKDYSRRRRDTDIEKDDGSDDELCLANIQIEEKKADDPVIIAQNMLIEKSTPSTDLEIALFAALQRKEAHVIRLAGEIRKLKSFISKRKQTYKRKRKEDGAPTRALSAYNIFIQDRFARLAKENEKALKSDDADAQLKRVPPANLVAATGNQWKELPADEKQKYEER